MINHLFAIYVQEVRVRVRSVRVHVRVRVQRVCACARGLCVRMHVCACAYVCDMIAYRWLPERYPVSFPLSSTTAMPETASSNSLARKRKEISLKVCILTGVKKEEKTIP